MGIEFVIKRNGQRAAFEPAKITSAISKAFGNVYMERPSDENVAEADKITAKVVEAINANSKQEWHVEDIQDLVEKVLMENDANVAKAYILYRHKRAEIRAFKKSLGIVDDGLKMPVNSLMVLAARYLLKDDNHQVVETPRQLFDRVSVAIANVELRYGKTREQLDGRAKEYFDAMTTFRFMPSTPILMNAGTPESQLSACFVIPVGDSIDEIFDAIKYAAQIHKTGGGTGFAFSRLRPANDVVGANRRMASGPVSFMKVFDAATEQIKQAGVRRGANMGILRIDHPDILEFIMMKESEGTLKNFNISVAVTEEFMKALDANKDYNLVNPHTQKVTGRLNARAVWNLIVTMAWKTGDPGLVFIDRMNNSFSNPVPSYGPIEATNPCVTGDTLISTAYGMHRADELASAAIPNLVLVDGRFYAGDRKLSSPVVQTGVKPVVRLTTKEGFEVKLTKDHRVYSDSRGWIEAGQLRHGEKIRITNTYGGFGGAGSAAEGRVLGWLVGDGHINMGAVNNSAVLSFYGTDMELADRFAKDVNSVIRVSESSNHVNKVGVVTIQSRSLKAIQSTRLKEFALSWGLGKEKLMVPEKVFSGSEELQKGFIQALFEADGTVSVLEKSRHTVRLTSISERLLREVQLLLLNFGVFSKIYKNRKKAGTKMMPGPDRTPKMYNVKAAHELSIDGANLIAFARNIGFISEHKHGKLLDALMSYTRGPYKEYFVATTASVEETGSEPVYDLNEPVTHSFIANGIVVHNCGEQALGPYDACNLGAINLAMMVKQTDHHFEVDWDELKRMTRLGVRFLDGVIDANRYPLKQITEVVTATRRIGLGVMGWADMLIALGIKYNSNEALLLGEQIMSFITEQGRKMSQELAEERGPFPAFKESVWYKLGSKPLRNSTITTVAPTGTTSIICGGTSQGIEPIFAVVYLRNVHSTLGYDLIEVNNEFERRALEKGYYSEELMRNLAGRVSIQDVEQIPLEERKLFVTAYDIAPEWHVKMQAAFQKYIDNSVSKTINFPNWATPQDIERAYKLAYDLGCKGITVYRDGSKNVQILQAVEKNPQQSIAAFSEMKQKHQEAQEERQGVTVAAIKAGAGSYIMSSAQETKCPECGTAMIAASGCFVCNKCGHSECG